jgi:hypothetical protein
VTGVTVAVEKGSIFVKGSGPTNLDAGDRIRLGYEFETSIVDEDEDDMMNDDGNTFKIKDAWNMESAGKFIHMSSKWEIYNCSYLI